MPAPVPRAPPATLDRSELPVSLRSWPGRIAPVRIDTRPVAHESGRCPAQTAGPGTACPPPDRNAVVPEGRERVRGAGPLEFQIFEDVVVNAALVGKQRVIPGTREPFLRGR